MSFSRGKVASSSSWAPPQEKYHVFLSFRGKDTRKSFTDHLFAALEVRGIATFRDDVSLNEGENIKLELPKAIEESRIFLVVFSKNYAESEWCMEELVKMMELRERYPKRHIVLPVFYDVKPSEVRAQMGSVADSLAKHQNCGRKVEKWKKILREFANLCGLDLEDSSGGYEATFIKEIIEVVERKLEHVSLHVAYHPVGIETHLKRLMQLLNRENCIVVIWGFGGIGKTELAKAVYNLIHRKFEGSSFVADVRDASNQSDGMVRLQKQIISDILKNENHVIGNVHKGSELIRNRVLRQKVLLVLDDVDSAQQLKDLIIDRSVLSRGSKIIITTRDRSYLNPFEPDEIFKVEELNKDESLELFSWHAFKQAKPKEDYLALSREVVCYSEGVPLALEVIGSLLFKKERPIWENAIKELKKIPNDVIQKKLQISFDSLSKQRKKLFLDIAYFFLGRSRDFTIKVVDECDLYPEIGIEELVDRCLIKIDKHGNLMMHDLLRDMGRQIPKAPEGPNRIWDHDDALDLLRLGKGTEMVEGLSLNFPEPRDVQVNAKAFEEMVRLRLLHLNYVRLNGGGCERKIFNRLVWLSWKGFPLECMPNLTMEKLVALDLCHSSLKHVWKGIKIQDKLRILNLSHCYCLTKTPDFSGLSNLEELLLNDCVRLVEVDESIVSLHKLVFLNLKNCKKLRKLPSGVLMLNSLEYLDLSGCSNLAILAGFRGTPSKFGYSWFLSCIPHIRSVNYIHFSLASNQSSCLKKLRLADCNLSHLPDEIGCLTSLRELDVSGNNFHVFPETIFNLPHLWALSLAGCERLQSLISYKSSSNLDKIRALDCPSLFTISWRREPCPFVYWPPDCFSRRRISVEMQLGLGQRVVTSRLEEGDDSEEGHNSEGHDSELEQEGHDLEEGDDLREVYLWDIPDTGLRLELFVECWKQTRWIVCRIEESQDAYPQIDVYNRVKLLGDSLTDPHDCFPTNHFRYIWLMIPLSGLKHPQVLWFRTSDFDCATEIRCSDELGFVLMGKWGPAYLFGWIKSIDEVEKEEEREDVVKVVLQADRETVTVMRYNWDLLPENTNRLLCFTNDMIRFWPWPRVKSPGSGPGSPNKAHSSRYQKC